jgi:hypothetical protein
LPSTATAGRSRRPGAGSGRPACSRAASHDPNRRLHRHSVHCFQHPPDGRLIRRPEPPRQRVVEIDANHYTITTYDDSIAAIGAFLRTS